VLINGQIVKTGTAELAQQIEEQGFDWIKEELA
jgi:Fe-S cluster assembly ATP-binding protein